MKLGSGRNGKWTVGGPFVVQVKPVFAVRFRSLSLDLDFVVGPYDARHCEFGV